MTLALLPQPGAREGRDRLEILSALITAPSFDPLFRPDIIKVPAGHPVYRWNCLAGCERTVMGHGDLCSTHQALWSRHRDEGGTRAGFLKMAQNLGPGDGIEEQPCRICPGRPACHLTLRLCHYHQWRWYNYRPRHGEAADFDRWLVRQVPSPGFGNCLVRVCPDKAFSPLGLCSRHDARYEREGRPGGAALPSQWGNRFERTGQPVPVEYASEPTFRRWCAATAAVLRPDQVNLRGLHPLLRAEIRWGMCWHTRRQHWKWELAPIQRLADYGRARGLRSLTDLDTDDPGLRKAAGREASRIAASIADGLHPVYTTPEETREAGYILTGHFGRKLNNRPGVRVRPDVSVRVRPDVSVVTGGFRWCCDLGVNGVSGGFAVVVPQEGSPFALSTAKTMRRRVTSSMITHPEHWMDIRKYRGLLEAGSVTYADIAAETGLDWRTVKKYLAEDAPVSPPGAGTPRAGTQPRKIDPFTGVIDAWLRADVRLKASVIHERLADGHGFTGNYQRVKMYVAEARPRIRRELEDQQDNPAGRGLHRRFEVRPGTQAQVDWGEERGPLIGTPVAYSFHMTLSYSRDTFCCYTGRTDLATFFGCHIRALEYFGGVPETIVYDRTKTVVKRHVAPGKAVPLHPEAVAFAGHYGFGIDVLAAYRPTGKGRVERQVEIVRSHVLDGRAFYSLQEMDAAFLHWAPLRARQVHRTHGEVIGVRAERDRAALRPLPEHPYLVAEQHLRRVGKDCLISFESSMYSVPARLVRPFQRVHVRAGDAQVTIHALPADGGGLLAVHHRARKRGSYVVDQAHWDGLPDGHTRAVTAGGHDGTAPGQGPCGLPDPGGLGMLLAAHPDAAAPVARRPLSDYEPGTRP